MFDGGPGRTAFAIRGAVFMLAVASLEAVGCGSNPATPSPSPSIAITAISAGNGSTLTYDSLVTVNVSSSVSSDAASIYTLPNGGALPIFYEFFVCLSTNSLDIASTCGRASGNAGSAIPAVIPPPPRFPGTSQTDYIVAFIVDSRNQGRYDVGGQIPDVVIAKDARQWTIHWQ